MDDIVLPTPPVPGRDVKACLTCHSHGGGATAFEWLAHFRHYSEEKFIGKCWSCRQIDQAGVFCLIETLEATEAKVSREVVEKMQVYFQSWATLKFVDHGHGLKKISCRLCHEFLLQARSL